MKDIDRNINALLFNINTEITDFIKNENYFESGNFSQIVNREVNITDDTTSVALAYPLSIDLDPGTYYYLHILKTVESDNTQCLFSLSTNADTSHPFYSYYAQSPLADSNGEIYIGKKLYFPLKTTLLVSRNKPVLPTCKLLSTIKIFKKKG